MKAKRLILTCLLSAAIGHASAQLVITKQTCNHQSGFAIVDTDHPVVGWQMTSDRNNDFQTAYQLEVIENGTETPIFTSRQTKSAESQLISLPFLPENSRGYKWRVKVWDSEKQPSEWSEWQIIHIAPKHIDATWVGAISKKDAKIPDGKWSNTTFKQQDFKDAWKDVDSLSTKSIEIRSQYSLNQSPENISNAVIYISGLGHYILNINGKRVSDAEFAPLWTDYSKTVYYNIYDITNILKTAASKTAAPQTATVPSASPLGSATVPEASASGYTATISALLGNGMYNVQKDGRYTKFQSSYGAPKLFYNLIINYKDGSQQTIKTDGSESYCLSDISFNSIYGGESITLAPQSAKPLHPVRIVESPNGKLLPQTAPPVKVTERYPIKTWQYTDSTRSTFVCDMGQNLAGFPEITYSNLTPGKTIKLTVSEKLDKSGIVNQKQTGRPHFYTISLPATAPSASPQKAATVPSAFMLGSNATVPSASPLGSTATVPEASASGPLTWHPHFSYYGFRFIQVEGAVMSGEPNPDNLPVIENLLSCFIHNSATEYSAFESSNPLFTDTHRLIERAERSNMQSVFTDCPHREKLGWLEQDHLCGPSLLYNYDLTTYGPKFIHDICDAQKPDGNVPTIAPQYVEFGNKWGDFDESPEWASTLIIFPFQYFEQYGDNSLILNNYDAMCRYVDFLSSRAEDNILSFGLGDWYDYQQNAAAGFSKNTPVPLVATAHYIYDLQLLIRASQITKNKKNAKKYTALLKQVTASFNKEFFNTDSCYYGNNSQCSNALPLFLGICPKGMEAKVYENLIADVMKSGKPRLTTGDVGNRYLIQTLSMQGNDQLVYDMFNHDETPGYGFQMKEGMTTLSEQWNPQFGTSLNHFMMGHLDEWLFKSMAGIRNAEGSNGLREIIIKPFFTNGLDRVKASTANLYGTISVDATPTAATVEIPVGCKATFCFPNGKTHKIGAGKHELSAF